MGPWDAQIGVGWGVPPRRSCCSRDGDENRSRALHSPPPPGWAPTAPAHTPSTRVKRPGFPGFQVRVTATSHSHLLDNPTHSLVGSTTAAPPQVCLSHPESRDSALGLSFHMADHSHTAMVTDALSSRTHTGLDESPPAKGLISISHQMDERLSECV